MSKQANSSECYCYFTRSAGGGIACKPTPTPTFAAGVIEARVEEEEVGFA